MSPRKFSVSRESRNNFQEQKTFKSKNNERNVFNANDSFFIKNKHFNSQNVAKVNKSNKNIDSKKDFLKKKQKQGSSVQDAESNTVKKPFDKKAWRLKRYSKKYKLEQWKDMKKINLLRGFDKTRNSSKSINSNFDEDDNNDKDRSNQETNILDTNDGTTSNVEGKLRKQNKKYPPKTVFNKSQINEEANDKKAEYLKRKAEKEGAIKEYKRRKLERFKKLNQKTKKGQPVMKGRIEVLLEQIQNSIKNN